MGKINFDIVKKFLASGVDAVISSAGNAIDKNVTNAGERMKLKQELSQIILQHTEKQTETAASVIIEEAKGSKLQRNWRPIVMLSFAAIVVYNYFIGVMFGLPVVKLEVDFWGLLKLGLGGYVIGRTGEKIVSNITDKIDIVPSRVKRKQKE